MIKFLAVFLLLVAGASAGGHRRHHHSSGHVSIAADWIYSRSSDLSIIGDEVDEFELGSESARRILATNRYISYNALRRDSIPCSRRGASYYNCRPGAQANPYSRGCSRISQCRS